MSRRGWLVLGFGILVSLAPLVWEPLVGAYPSDAGFGLALFYGWSAIPFLTLAVLSTGLKVGWPAFITAATLATGATVFMQVDVLLYASGSTDSLAFIFLPIWLGLAVGAVVGVEQVVRAGARRFRLPSRR